MMMVDNACVKFHFIITSCSSAGFLGQCMESLLLDQTFWLSSVEDNVSIEVSIQEETLSLIYKRILMQDGEWWSPSDCNGYRMQLMRRAVFHTFSFSPLQVRCLPGALPTRCLTAPPLAETCTWSKGTSPSLSLPSWAQVGPSSPWLTEAEEPLPNQLWSRSLLFTSESHTAHTLWAVRTPGSPFSDPTTHLFTGGFSNPVPREF